MPGFLFLIPVGVVLVGEVNTADFTKCLVQPVHGEGVSSDIGRLLGVENDLLVEGVRPNVTVLKSRVSA